MVEFETIKAEEISFGNNNFIEVARKKAISDDGENEFISISRGFVTQTGEKRYKKSFSVPTNKEIVNFVTQNLETMLTEGSGPSAENSQNEQTQNENMQNDQSKEQTQQQL